MKWQQSFPQQTLNSEDTLPELLITYLESWKSITVSGDDRKSYLQGQVTCDVATLKTDEATLGAHCDAKGKVWSIFRLFNHKDSYALFQHASAIENALKEIKKYSVFSKVDISISSDIALGIIGPNAEGFIDALSEGSGDVRAVSGGSAIKIEEERWLLLIDEASALSLLDNHPDLAHYHEAIWDKYDIEAAIPRITTDNQNEHIPQAFNLQALFGINFSKGCYTGQETVARAKYRGTNKREMFIVKGKMSSPINGKISLERSVGENWRAVGSLMTHYYFSDGGCIGLIILPNNLDPDSLLRLSDQPESIWEILPLPYSLSN